MSTTALVVYFMQQSSRNRETPEFVHRLFSSIAGRYDLANHVLCGGLDIYWRRVTARELAQHAPRRVLDLATGSGDLALAIRRALPEAQIVGGDFCFPMLQVARRKHTLPLVVADGLHLPFRDAVFDAVTIAFGLRNMEDRSRALQECSRILVPGGQLLVLDFSLPEAPLRAPYRWYLHTLLPRIAGVVTGEAEAYKYLGESIEAFPSGEKMCDLMRASGFATARSRTLSFGIVSLFIAGK